MLKDISHNKSELVFGEARDALLVSIATKSTWGGMFSSIYGWLTQTDSAIFIGIVVTLLGFAMNYVFQRSRSKRETSLWEEQLKAHLRAEERKEEIHKARLFNILNGDQLMESEEHE